MSSSVPSSVSSPTSPSPPSGDWVSRTADAVISAANQRQLDPIVCASGLTPSGPIHLGNLRELLTQHLVAEEIRARGHACEHVLFWDDYDRLRRLPAGVPDRFAEHLGRALTAVPDPAGEYGSWAERYQAPLRAVLDRLGIRVREVSQARRYADGSYTNAVLRAVAQRDHIRSTLARYRTKETSDSAESDFFPYRVYCRACGRDQTTVNRYVDETHVLGYHCADCQRSDEFDLSEVNAGKLVWKVDWPMRWAHEPVAFEAAGADHSSPGSSATVGFDLCRDVFGAEPPVYLGYSFVGARGSAKLSSSAGDVPTPQDALEILEPEILRWLYARRQPRQSITVDFGSEVTRLYEEWDRLGDRVAAGTAGAVEASAYHRATLPGGGPARPARVSWRILTSVIDITAGDEAQLRRVLRSVAGDADLTLGDLEPRLTLARGWVATQVPEPDRTHVRTEPDQTRLEALATAERDAIRLLLDRIDDDWSLPGLTRLVYGIPKIRGGLSLDAEPTAQLKQEQRQFFALLYQLLLGRETGPRLPTLLLAIGSARLRRLLDADASRSGRAGL